MTVMVETTKRLKRGEIVIYTDGGCQPNPGPGGYGGVILGGMYEIPYSGGRLKTTNNIMEMMAVIRGLEALRQRRTDPGHLFPHVTVYSDSQYVINGITKWIHAWRKRGWVTTEGKVVKNKALWQRLDGAVGQLNRVEFLWVKGHSGEHYNEMADGLATAGRERVLMGAEA